MADPSPVEPLWTGQTDEVRYVSCVERSIIQPGWLPAPPNTGVAIVLWPLPAVTREQVLQAILDVRVPPDRPGVGCQYQALSERGEIPGVVADAVMRLLSGQATEEDATDG
jgi:hypothetical protein